MQCKCAKVAFLWLISYYLYGKLSGLEESNHLDLNKISENISYLNEADFPSTRISMTWFA